MNSGEDHPVRTSRLGFLLNPGTYLAFAGFLIFIAPILDVFSVEGMMEPGTGSVMMVITVLFGLLTVFAGFVVAVKERKTNG